MSDRSTSRISNSHSSRYSSYRSNCEPSSDDERPRYDEMDPDIVGSIFLSGDMLDVIDVTISKYPEPERDILMKCIDERVKSGIDVVRSQIEVNRDTSRWYREDITRRVLQEIADDEVDDPVKRSLASKVKNLLLALIYPIEIYITADGLKHFSYMIGKMAKDRIDYGHMISDAVHSMLNYPSLWTPLLLVQDLVKYKSNSCHCSGILSWNRSMFLSAAQIISNTSQKMYSHKNKNTNCQIIYGTPKVSGRYVPADRSSVKSFIDNECIEGEYTHTDRLYMHYKRYCDRYNITPSTSRLLSEGLKAANFKGDKDSHKRGWYCTVRDDED